MGRPWPASITSRASANMRTTSCARRGAALLTKRWMLKAIRGETGCDELPAHPSPSFAPEAVVQAQLQALRCASRQGKNAAAVVLRRRACCCPLHLLRSAGASAPLGA